MPWYTMTDCLDVDEWHGTNAFIREDDGGVFRIYFVNAGGDEAMGSNGDLDLTALGRQEEWGDSPAGYPQTKPYERWIWRDEA